MLLKAMCFCSLVGLCALGLAPAAVADCPPRPDPGALALNDPPPKGNLTVGDDLVLRPKATAFAPRAKPVKQVPPIYPSCAKAVQIPGVVDVEFMVEQDGSIDNVKVDREVPAGFGFAEAAVKAVSQWKYEPALVEGKPVAALTRVRISTHSSGH